MTATLELPTWQKTDKYHLESGDYTISKSYSGGVAKYVFWRGDTMIGIFKTLGQAQEAAK